MYKVFGDFDEDIYNAQQYLIIVCSPTSMSLKQRWRNNGLSADFMADYFATFFTSEKGTSTDNRIRAEVKSTVSFIANELLENAMKFSDERSSYSISMKLQLQSNKLIFITTNSLNIHAIAKLQAFIDELLISEPSELYIRQLEKNAEDENNKGSGLGYLTMINDYAAKIGWKFEIAPQQPEVNTVTTMVQLAL